MTSVQSKLSILYLRCLFPQVAFRGAEVGFPFNSLFEMLLETVLERPELEESLSILYLRCPSTMPRAAPASLSVFQFSI